MALLSPLLLEFLQIFAIVSFTKGLRIHVAAHTTHLVISIQFNSIQLSSNNRKCQVFRAKECVAGMVKLSAYAIGNK